jgi:branched-chain amino acid transport system substrate-binding protein
LKKIIFLIIAAMLVIGLVLPGCGEGPGDEDTRPVITLGIAGPMGAAQGDHHYYGAEMAANEVNGSDPETDGVDVGGTLHKIELVAIDTNEILNPSGADGVTRMEDNIDDVDFVLGGFRTEAVLAYREVVMDAGKLFIDCGAATEELSRSCALNYTNYKYWFKGTPPNEIFLSISQGKLLVAIVGAARETGGNATWEPSIAFMIENAKWTEASQLMTYASLGPPDKNWLVPSVGSPNPANPDHWMWKPSPVATVSEMNTLLTSMAAQDPDIILSVMSGPCGATFGNRVGVYMPDALVYGINVEAQRSEYADLPYAEGTIFLDTWSEGVNYTDKTADFVSTFETEYGELPIYTAATYDAVLALVEAIEGKDSTATADIIDWMEDPANAREGTTGVSGYYQPWDGVTTGDSDFGTGLPALNEGQVLELYPWLPDAVYSPDGSTKVAWTYDSDDWTMPPHDTHDLVYGTQWVTGVAAQWQDVDGTLKKVGIWPTVLNDALPTDLASWLVAANTTIPAATLYYLEETAMLWDQYGWWNFAYPGTVAPDLTDWITWLITNGRI